MSVTKKDFLRVYKENEGKNHEEWDTERLEREAEAAWERYAKILRNFEKEAV